MKSFHIGEAFVRRGQGMYLRFMNPYIVLAASIVIYFALHSVMAATAIKRHFSPRPYRIFYVIVASAGLMGILVINASIAAPHFFRSEGFIRYLSLMLTVFGVMTIQASFKQYGLMPFLGVRDETPGLKTDGILQHVRHPLYSGTILIVLGFFLFIPNLPTLITCGGILLYLPIGIYLEEKKLIAAFGEEYIKYRERVPSLIPKLK